MHYSLKALHRGHYECEWIVRQLTGPSLNGQCFYDNGLFATRLH